MQDQNQIVEFVIIASFATFFFVLMIILVMMRHRKKMHQNALHLLQIEQTKQKELFKAAADAENNEKERIATNLHDEISIVLSSLKQNLLKQKRQLSPGSPEMEINNTGTDLIEQAIEGLATSIFELAPKYMLNFGLSSSLKKDLSVIKSTRNIPTTFNNPSNFCFEDRFQKSQLININRLCHELLNNILKHGKCTEIILSIVSISNCVFINISHNGIILTNEEVDKLTDASHGLGLKSIKARALVLNADINYIQKNNFSQIQIQLRFINE